MNHLSEQELLDCYYGEGNDAEGKNMRANDMRADDMGAIGHLAACEVCREAFAALCLELEAVLPETRGSDSQAYGDQVWQKLRSSFTPYAKPKRKWFAMTPWGGLALAAASAVLLLIAFFAGRSWEGRHARETAQNGPAAHDPQARERVIVFVLGDHLDRSEQLLVELSHPEEAAGDVQFQATARKLLAENRLYRQSAGERGQGGLEGGLSVDGTLEDLEQLLVEVADNPDGLSRAEIRQIQKEMHTGSLLFEVRVLRSRIQQQENLPNNGKGGSA